MKVEVSNGEILDKVSILEIKIANITNSEKLINVRKELDILRPLSSPLLRIGNVQELYQDLLRTNTRLWHIEDKLREKERMLAFDTEFIELARDVYFTNDKRAEIKKQINTITNSELTEEKSYEQY
jgi:hypothetical protein